MSDDICGEPTSNGEPCQRPAGWGRDEEQGPCVTHHEEDTTQTGGPANRPSKLTMQRQENIAAMLEEGHSVAAACRCNEIDRSTFYAWLRKGDDQSEGIFSDFSNRVARARGAGEQQLVDDLLEMAREQQDTRALLSVLKSRFPESWGDADAEDDGAQVNVFLTADRDDA